MLTDLKGSEDFVFLKAVDSIALQQSLRDLDRGYVNFFQKRALIKMYKMNNETCILSDSLTGINSVKHIAFYDLVIF